MSENHVIMSANGRIVIPASIRRAIGMPHGGSFVVHLRDGEVHLEPTTLAIARVQSLVRQYVPEAVSLSDELIAERRAAAERE